MFLDLGCNENDFSILSNVHAQSPDISQAVDKIDSQEIGAYTKVDCSAVYAARWIAKNLVAARIAKEVEIQLSYAIGLTNLFQ